MTHLLSQIFSRWWNLPLICSCAPPLCQHWTCRYVSRINVEKETCCSVYRLSATGQMFVSFRGTTARSLAGEDLLTSASRFTSEINQQHYERIRTRRWQWHYLRNVMVGGHSKGGNLAAYAATVCLTSCGTIDRVWVTTVPNMCPEIPTPQP